jgi:hypothetical protein
MPYPNAASATANYAPDKYARWVDLLKGLGPEALPGPHDYTTKTRLRLSAGPGGGVQTWPLRFPATGTNANYYATEFSNRTGAGERRLPLRGNIDYLVTYTLDGTTDITAPAGAQIFQEHGAGTNLLPYGRLAFALSGRPTEVVVTFSDPPPSDDFSGVVSFNTWKATSSISDPIITRIPPDQHIDLSIIEDVYSPRKTIAGNKITSVHETTIYTWTDYGTDIPTGDDAMGGTCTRGSSGLARDTITCILDGLPEYVMLEGDPAVVFEAGTSISIRQYQNEIMMRGVTSPKDKAIFKSSQTSTACGQPSDNKCLECNVCGFPTLGCSKDTAKDECMQDSDCVGLASSPGSTKKCKDNPLPRFLRADRYVNPASRYAVCGVTTRIVGDMYINDMPNNTKGFYLGGCSGSGVTSIDSRTWASNDVASTMTELILDDTSIVNAPDISSLVNLERLSISGDQYDSQMTALPNISGLTKLKFLNISRQPAIDVSLPFSFLFYLFSCSPTLLNPAC